MDPSPADMASTVVQQLQSAIHSLQTSLSPDVPAVCCEQIASVSGFAEALLQHHAELQQALENKSIAERALRNVVANKDTEAARLRGEVQRLHSNNSNNLQESASDTRQQQHEALQDADGSDVLDPAEREAVLEAAVAAKDKPTALLHELQSEVSACHARIAALESELTAATAEHNTRLTQQQKAFLAKLEQLRQVHNQQVAAAIREAQKQVEQHNTRNRQLKEQLAHSKQQLVQQQEAIAALRQQLQQKHQQQPGSKKPPPPCPVQSAAPDSSAAADTAPTASNLQGPLSAAAAAGGGAKDHPGTSTATAAAAASAAAGDQSKSKAEAKAAVMAEVAALKDMEAQLARLSATVKSYQGEREQLRQALMAGVAERQALQQQVQELTTKLQAGQGGCKQAVLEADSQQELSRAYWGSLANPL